MSVTKYYRDWKPFYNVLTQSAGISDIRYRILETEGKLAGARRVVQNAKDELRALKRIRREKRLS